MTARKEQLQIERVAPVASLRLPLPGLTIRVQAEASVTSKADARALKPKHRHVLGSYAKKPSRTAQLRSDAGFVAGSTCNPGPGGMDGRRKVQIMG
eukprot:scaffold162_cov275-Pinguiococcus_pyrenoidosus.AAC.1